MKSKKKDMISDALLDAYDMRKTLLDRNPEALWTVGDCLDNIIEILEALDK